MNGIVQEPAVNKWWCLKRPPVLYYPVPILSDDKISACEQGETWLRRNAHFQSEIEWLLSLDHHRFWSQVVYCPAAMYGLISFLQEALPYYVLPEYLSTPRIEESYHETARLVFMVFVRLGSSNDYPSYFPEEKQAQVIYEHHIFSLPILLDLCHLYARENRRAISKIVLNVFRIQPNFNQDIPQLVTFLEDGLKMLTHSFCGAAAVRDDCGEPMPLALGGEHTALEDMRFDQCKDKLLYLLDAISSCNAFLDIYSLACKTFRRRHFHNRLAIFYNDVIPRIEKKIESCAANDDLIMLYVDLKQKLNICKIELLQLFRYITTSVIYRALEKRDQMSVDEITEEVEEYLNSITDCLTEHTFMQDYHNVHGVDIDLDSISQILSNVDNVKLEYLLEVIHSSFQTPKERRKPDLISNRKPTVSKKKSSSSINPDQEQAGPSSSSSANRPTGVELDSLISQVKDLLPDLGDGFIQKCLEYYNFQSDQVINAVLESSLPKHLQELDPSLPVIPPEQNDDELPRRLNVFDNDEFDFMTRDNIDMSRVHKGKRRTVPKNVFDLLNDKSDIEAVRDRYTLYGSVDTTGNIYDDEYDDTYDDDIGVREAGDVERKEFVIPRVLQSSKKESGEEDESSEEEEEEEPRSRDEFCQNPAELRARAEQRRQDKMRGGGGRGRGGNGGGAGSGGGQPKRDVVGKPKGQGQDKQVTVNRDHKNVNKSSRGNHNRRKGAQFKRNQGMIPS